jgi:predicted nucleic acid-binding protein
VTGAVIDASIAVTWCFADQATPETDRLLDQVRDEGAFVPTLWRLELANVLLQAEKRGRIDADDVEKRLSLIAQLPISIDPDANSRAWREVVDLARNEGLTSYDASYLELALRRRIPLMTLDRDLAAAAKRRGVDAVPA